MTDGPTREQLAELSKLRDLEWKTIREIALKSTFGMASLVCWPDVAHIHYDENGHKPLCDWVDETPVGGNRAIILHRAARKTMLLNIAHCLRLITAFPTIRIILISALQRTAWAMCSLLKRQFTHNQSYRHYFPEMAINDPKWGRQDEFDHPMAGARVGQLDSSFFASYTGAPLISKRCDVLIFDDPVADDAVSNPDTAAQVMSQFLQTIPLVDVTSPHKKRFFIGTYKSYLDPASAITGKQSTSEDVKRELSSWEYVIRPISYVPSGDFHNPGPFAFPDENPEAVPFLPKVWTPERIREEYNLCLADKDKGEAYFAREYSCLIQAPGDQKFRAEWFDTWVEPAQVPPNTVFSAIAVDSAIKDEQMMFKGDNTVIFIGHFDMHNNLYLTDAARSRSWKMDDFRKVLLAMVDNPKNRGAQNLLREKIGEGVMFPTIRNWFNEARKPLVMFPLKVIGQGKKYLRITEALQAPAMGRKILFVRGSFPPDIHKVLVDELSHLGQWGHDDAADALSLFFHPEVRPVQSNYAPKTVWKDVVSRPMQVSTASNNHAVALHEQQMNAPKTAPNTRLTPFGAESTLSWTEISEQPAAQPWATGDDQPIEQSKVNRFMPKLEKING